MISGRASLPLLCALAVLCAQTPVSLQLNTPVRASVGGWEPQLYQIDLQAGQYVELVVEEKGLSIQVRLIDPAGKKVLDMIDAAGTNGIYFIAQAGGLHRVEIAALEPFDRPFGDCQVTVVRLASPTPKDRLRAEALQSYLRASDSDRVDAYKRAAGLFAEAGLPQDEIRALRAAAFVASELSDLQSEIVLREQILTRQRGLGDQVGEGSSLYDIALAYAKLTQYEKALQYDEKALAIARERKDRYVESYVLDHIGTLYSNLNQHQKALDYFGPGLAAAHDAQDYRGEGVVLSHIAQAYQELGQSGRAVVYAEQALAHQRTTRDRRARKVTLAVLGAAYKSLGQYGKAIECYGQALYLARDDADRRREAEILSGMVAAYISLFCSPALLKAPSF